MTQAPADRRQANLTSILTILAIMVVIGFTWRGCWYATPLGDDTIATYLAGDGSPQDIQKALSQLKDRAHEGEDLSRFHEGLAGLTDHEVVQIRATLAWTLGALTEDERLVAALRKLVADDAATVRYNAATSLAPKDFDAARPVLHEMLTQVTVKAPVAGKLDVPRNRKSLQVGLILGRVESKDGVRHDVTSPIAGRLRKTVQAHGTEVAQGDDLFLIEPTMGQIENALVVLRLLGKKEDAPAIQGIVEGRIQVDEGTRRLAQATLETIRTR